jgi:hypothetical protein
MLASNPRALVIVIKPVRMNTVTTAAIAEYVAKRLTEPRTKNGPLLAKATINKELRHLRAVLVLAVKWKFLQALPEFDFLKERKKLPTYIPPEDFLAMYGACSAAQGPKKRAEHHSTSVVGRAARVRLPDRLADRRDPRPAVGRRRPRRRYGAHARR